MEISTGKLTEEKIQEKLTRDFQDQLSVLWDKKCNNTSLTKIEKSWKKASKEAKEILLEKEVEDNFYLMPVINTGKCISMTELIQMVEKEGERGQTRIEEENIINKVTHDFPDVYFILQNDENEFGKKLTLSAEEMIVHSIFKEIIDDFIWIDGSYHKYNGYYKSILINFKPDHPPLLCSCPMDVLLEEKPPLFLYGKRIKP